MCGDKRFSAEVPSDEAYLCHCRMCQRASGNMSLALFNLKKAAVTWTKGKPDEFRSSPIAVRSHCATCGTTLTFAFPESQNMDLAVASFDEPGYFRCTSHSGTESMHRHWLNTEGLKEERTEDQPHIVKKWMDATGKMPD